MAVSDNGRLLWTGTILSPLHRPCEATYGDADKQAANSFAIFFKLTEVMLCFNKFLLSSNWWCILSGYSGMNILNNVKGLPPYPNGLPMFTFYFLYHLLEGVLIFYEHAFECLGRHSSLVSFSELNTIIHTLFISHYVSKFARTWEWRLTGHWSKQSICSTCSIQNVWLIRVCSVVHYHRLVCNSGHRGNHPAGIKGKQSIVDQCKTYTHIALKENVSQIIKYHNKLGPHGWC